MARFTCLRLAALSIVVVSACGAVSAEQPVGELPAGVRRLVERALATNPRLRAMAKRVDSVSAAATRDGALPDGHVSVGWYLREVETRVGPQTWQAALSQTFPHGSKRRARNALQRKRAAALAARLDWERRVVAFDIERTCNEYHLLEASVSVVHRTLTLLEQLEQVGRAAFRTDRLGFGSVLKVQVEQDRARDRLQSLLEKRRPLAAHLAQLVGLSADEPLSWPTALRSVQKTVVPTGPALHRAILVNPSVIARDLDVEVQRIERRLARLGERPDTTVSLRYINTDDAVMSGVADSGKDPIIAMFSWNVPFATRRISADVKRATALEGAAGNEREATIDRLTARVATTSFHLDDALRRIDLYDKSILPKLRQTRAVDRASFTAGTAAFLDLIDTERALLDVELELERARVDAATAAAELDLILEGGSER